MVSSLAGGMTSYPLIRRRCTQPMKPGIDVAPDNLEEDKYIFI